MKRNNYIARWGRLEYIDPILINAHRCWIFIRDLTFDIRHTMTSKKGRKAVTTYIGELSRYPFKVPTVAQLATKEYIERCSFLYYNFLEKNATVICNMAAELRQQTDEKKVFYPYELREKHIRNIKQFLP